MRRLWLTYAWKDNADNQVDYLINMLERTGLTCLYDRVQFSAGQRLWDQIDKSITDPAQCDAWSIYTTANSLRSEACLEELAYALDRALRSRQTAFPIIGIFSEHVERQYIPSAIATRLYVTLDDPNWASRVRAGCEGQAPQLDRQSFEPYKLIHHPDADNCYCLEIRPRIGTWTPFIYLVPPGQRRLLRNIPVAAPSGKPPEIKRSFGQTGNITFADGWSGYYFTDTVSVNTSAYLYFKALPTEISFGSGSLNERSTRAHLHTVAFGNHPGGYDPDGWLDPEWLDER